MRTENVKKVYLFTVFIRTSVFSFGVLCVIKKIFVTGENTQGRKQQFFTFLLSSLSRSYLSDSFMVRIFPARASESVAVWLSK